MTILIRHEWAMKMKWLHAGHWFFWCMYLLIRWTVMDHEKICIRTPEMKAETLHPYTLDWPSAKSSTRAFTLLLRESFSTISQDTNFFAVEHSFFLRLTAARTVLWRSLNSTMDMTSESGGKVSAEHSTSCRSWKPWNGREDNPAKGPKA